MNTNTNTTQIDEALKWIQLFKEGNRLESFSIRKNEFREIESLEQLLYSIRFKLKISIAPEPQPKKLREFWLNWCEGHSHHRTWDNAPLEKKCLACNIIHVREIDPAQEALIKEYVEALENVQDYYINAKRQHDSVYIGVVNDKIQSLRKQLGRV